jgi:hypothetical protein
MKRCRIKSVLRVDDFRMARNIVRALPALWDKKELRCSPFAHFLRRVICPTGCVREFLSSPLAKNKSLHETPKSILQLSPSRSTRGALRGRHERWVRDAVDAAASGATISQGEPNS